MWIIALAIICGTGLFICEGSEIMNGIANMRNKKIEEEHKTTNLALIYQILSVRPELSLDDVVRCIDSKDMAMIELASKADLPKVK